MNALIQQIPEVFIQQVGLTLLHSLWQAAAVYVVYIVVSYLLKSASASSRYYLAFLALMAMFLLPIVTYLRLSNNSVTQLVVERASPGYTVEEVAYVLADTRFNVNHYLQIIEDFLTAFAPWFVWFWIFGLILMAVRMTGGYVLAYRLTRKQCLVAPSQWLDRLKHMADAMAIKTPISLFESYRIDMPMVIGHLKPVILVPIGTFARLPYDQVEMILAHELAHIKRADFMLNLFQSIVESFLFFNPFVWLISSHIRNEREHACDDLALSVNGQKLSLAKALVTLAEKQANKITFHSNAMLTFNKINTMKRIERLFTNHKLKPTSFEKLMVISISMMLMLLVSFSGTLSSATASTWPFQQAKNEYPVVSKHSPNVSQPDSLKKLRKPEKVVMIEEVEEAKAPVEPEEIDSSSMDIEVESVIIDGKPSKQIIKIINGDTVLQVYSDHFEFEFDDEPADLEGKRTEKVYRFHRFPGGQDAEAMPGSEFDRHEMKRFFDAQQFESDSMRLMIDNLSNMAMMFRDSVENIIILKQGAMADSILKTIEWKEIQHAVERDRNLQRQEFRSRTEAPARPEKPAKARYPEVREWVQQQQNPYHRLLLKEMEEEGLASKRSSVILSTKQLIIDGKVADRKTQKRILKRYEAVTGEKLAEDLAITLNK